MGAYVRFERSQIDGVVSPAMAEEASAGGSGSSSSLLPSGGAGMSGAPLFKSCTQLFFQSRNSMSRCSELNRGPTLFALFKEVKEAFALYAAGLEARIPKALPPAAGSLPGDSYDVPEDAAKATALVDTLCLIVNTAEYAGA